MAEEPGHLRGVPTEPEQVRRACVPERVPGNPRLGPEPLLPGPRRRGDHLADSGRSGRRFQHPLGEVPGVHPSAERANEHQRVVLGAGRLAMLPQQRV